MAVAIPLMSVMIFLGMKSVLTITGTWTIWGADIIAIFVVTRIAPIFLIIHGDTATFIGPPWVFRIRRDKLADLIVENYRISFLPNYPKDYRWAYKVEKGAEMEGYKGIGFVNLKAIGALIDLLQPPPSKMIIHWEFLNEKARKYLIKKLSELEQNAEETGKNR